MVWLLRYSGVAVPRQAGRAGAVDFSGGMNLRMPRALSHRLRSIYARRMAIPSAASGAVMAWGVSCSTTMVFAAVASAMT